MINVSSISSDKEHIKFMVSIITVIKYMLVKPETRNLLTQVVSSAEREYISIFKSVIDRSAVCVDETGIIDYQLSCVNNSVAMTVFTEVMDRLTSNINQRMFSSSNPRVLINQILLAIIDIDLNPSMDMDDEYHQYHAFVTSLESKTTVKLDQVDLLLVRGVVRYIVTQFTQETASVVTSLNPNLSPNDRLVLLRYINRTRTSPGFAGHGADTDKLLRIIKERQPEGDNHDSFSAIAHILLHDSPEQPAGVRLRLS